MYMSACTWDNDLVNQKEEQMKPIEITKQDVLGYEHTFVVRHGTSTNKVSSPRSTLISVAGRSVVYSA